MREFIRTPRRGVRRGYALIMVLLMGVVLATLSGILLYAAARDGVEGRQQLNGVRALYAAESAVAVGVDTVASELLVNTSPDLPALQTTAQTRLAGAFPGVTLPTFSIKYLVNGVPSSTQPSITTLSTITSGPNAGLLAAALPIQVLASARVNNAAATVADAVRIDLIPIFQFAIFTDGDFEIHQPAPITITGRVHSNGNLYVSGGCATVNSVTGACVTASTDVLTFQSPVTVARRVQNTALFDSSTGVAGSSSIRFRNPAGTGFSYVQALSSGALSSKTNTQQQSYLSTNFGSNVIDSTGGQTALSVPLSLSSTVTCVTSSTCASGNTCVVPTGASEGVCMDRIVSRPDICGNAASAGSGDNFAQSIAINIIKRPSAEYTSRYTTLATSVYDETYGPTPAAAGADGFVDVDDVTVTRNVPLTQTSRSSDDQGVDDERFYWKANLRIIDGIWYRVTSTGDNVVVFDPETWDFGVSSFTPSSMSGNALLGHKFARVQRYSWFWDPRESRVYSGGSKYQRGLQIRASDFDVAAFNDLLSDSSAVTLLFGGTIPAGGIVVYVSETYDPSFDDANTRLPRTSNVRNFLNFPVMENHSDGTLAVTVAAPTRGSGGAQATPTQRGWFPSNLWGRNAPALFRSLTPAQASTSAAANKSTTVLAEARAFYASPTLFDSSLSAWGSGFDCQEPSLLTAARLPTSTTDFGPPPCIQSGATPRGPENAVRIVRAQVVPTQGLTIATDNRLYVRGDVNVVSTGGTGISINGVETRQRIAGKVSIVADSLTLLSQRFSDRIMQRGADRSGSALINKKARFSSVDSSVLAAVPGVKAWTSEALTEDDSGTAGEDLGNAPNLCRVGAAISSSGSTADLAVLPSSWPANTAPRRAFATRYNMSFIAGDVPSCAGGGSNPGSNSGGLINFPRFLEDWSSTDMLINGSMVSLYRSEQGNARFLGSSFAQGAESWKAGRKAAAYDSWGSTSVSESPCVYVPPARKWAFDSGLTQPSSLPPGTPRVRATDRLRWFRR